jgi:hypothetical protein
MALYDQIALDAVYFCKEQNLLSPREAWDKAARSHYPDKEAARNKGCPKSAFLGLCEEGIVENIPTGGYIKGKLNKSYALRALELLESNPNLNIKELWKLVQPNKSHNEQMNVVKALFDQGLVKTKK